METKERYTLSKEKFLLAGVTEERFCEWFEWQTKNGWKMPDGTPIRSLDYAIEKGIDQHLKWQKQDQHKSNQSGLKGLKTVEAKFDAQPTAFDAQPSASVNNRRVIELELQAFGDIAPCGRKVKNREAYIEWRLACN